MADVMEEYQSSLEDLTFNSKPHINMLTMLAEEHKNHSESIVHLIEAQIAKWYVVQCILGQLNRLLRKQASAKLPLLYLVDSIVKNVGENYKPLFAKNLSSTFKLAFETANEKSKLSLFKLRTTWGNYFPLKKLYNLDITIKELDPNWPVKPLPANLQDNSATTIHVNPKFIKKNDVSQPNVSSTSTPKKGAQNVTKTTKSPTLQHSDAEVDKIRQQLVRQQKELLDLQQKKLILELEQTKQQLAAKQRVVQQSASKKQDKVIKDPRKQVPVTSAPGGLRVTLSNVKAAAPHATGTPSQTSAPLQDPRLKSSTLTAAGKNNLVSSTKAEVPKVATPTKKKVSRMVGKKEKPSPPKPKSNQASSAAKPTREIKPTSMSSKKKLNTLSPPIDRKKRRNKRNKLSPSPSPPPPKIARNTIPPHQLSEQRRRPKPIADKPKPRIPKLKDRPSERPMSPRFSPEPETDDSHPPRNIPPDPYHRREDALRRRPSFDPDLFIPKQLTLSHQNEILKQADHQLRTGQLTHRQHQELLKQLHQLFEVQRMKKLQDADERHHEIGHVPIDPRQSRRHRREPRSFEKVRQGRRKESVIRPPRLLPKNLNQPRMSPERVRRRQSPDYEAPKQLEEPEDYIIAGVTDPVVEDVKISCEEPEDFIISQIPPGAEAYHNHSMGLRRNSDSEKAYLDHMKKIKQSIYTKELTGTKRKSSVSDSDQTTAEESATEKPSTLSESSSEKEGVKSPLLPLKKRRYVSSEDAKAAKSNDVKAAKPNDAKLNDANVAKPNNSKVLKQNEKSTDKEEKSAVIEDKAPLRSEFENKDKSTKLETSEPEKPIDKTVSVSEKVDKDPYKSDKFKVDKDSNKSGKDSNKSDSIIKENKPKEKTKSQKASSLVKKVTSDEKTAAGAKKESFKKVKQKSTMEEPTKNSKLRKENDTKSRKKFEKYRRKETEEKNLAKSSENSLVYIIEDEDLEESKPLRRPTKRPFPPRSEEMRRRMFEEEEEARIQQMMQEEQKKMEWEEKLARELEREQWNEEQFRRDRMRPDRGRGRMSHPDRWNSPPPDVRKAGSFDIARGQILHRGQDARHRPRRSDEPPRGLPPPPFLANDDIRMRRPMDDPRRPPSPGMIRHPPGWDPRRPRTPPGLRLPPPPLPPFLEPHDERMAEWERHAGRLRPREPPFHSDEMRRSPVEHHRIPNEPPVAPRYNQVNVNKLLTDLVNMGILPGSKKPDSKSASPVPTSQPPPEETTTSSPTKLEPVPAEDKQEEIARSVSPFIEREDLMMLDPDAEIPDVTLSSDLKERHDEIIKRIYTGIQCSACGLRFTTRQTDLYADHLDWHYRINRKDKEGAVATHRELFPSAGDWICYEEVENHQDRAKSAFFDDADEEGDISKADNDLTVPLTGKSGEDTCKVCKEAFETFYNENTDEWQFANCVKVDDDNFHPNCYGDYNDQAAPSVENVEAIKEESSSRQHDVLQSPEITIKEEDSSSQQRDVSELLETTIKGEESSSQRKDVSQSPETTMNEEESSSQRKDVSESSAITIKEEEPSSQEKDNIKSLVITIKDEESSSQEKDISESPATTNKEEEPSSQRKDVSESPALTIKEEESFSQEKDILESPSTTIMEENPSSQEKDNIESPSTTVKEEIPSSQENIASGLPES